MDEVTIAVQEALEKQVPHPNAVRQVLQKRSEERMEPSPIAIPLPDDKRVKDLNIKTHALIGYDQINATADDDQQRQQAQPIQPFHKPGRREAMNTIAAARVEQLKERAKALKLYGLINQWEELTESDYEWVNKLIQWEETQRHYRSLERRLSSAKLGRFKMLADFDWNWLKTCDRGAVEDLMTLAFLKDASNAIFVGPNGVGKTTVAKNIAHTAVLKGKKVLFTTAAKMLNELAACDGDMALQRRLRYYSTPDVLCIDEVGYLSYSNRHADLLFEIINRRYEQKSTLITTNRPFSEWGEVFPGAACVVSLIDRLIHHAEIISFEGESYRLKEAKERAEKKQKKRTEKNNEKH